MFKFFLAITVITLAFIQTAWLSMFALDLFFDTSRSTAAERARTIFHYMAFLITVQVGIVVLFILILYSGSPDGIFGLEGAP